MENLLTVEKLVTEAKKLGIDFGKGDPYNRIRYYTKIGWLPHMQRKKEDEGPAKGHFSPQTLDKLVLIERLKTSGLCNEEITKKLEEKQKISNIKQVVSTKEFKSRIAFYTMAVLILVILANEFNIIHLGRSKNDIVNWTATGDGTIEIINNGASFVPKDHARVYISNSSAVADSRINVTFTTDYSPAIRYWVSEIKPGNGFWLDMDTPVSQNATFTWFQTN